MQYSTVQYSSDVTNLRLSNFLLRTADLDQVAVSVKPTDGDIARSLRRVQEPGTLREDPALGLHTEGSVIPGTVLVSKLRSNLLHWSFGCDSYRVDLKFVIVQVFLFNILIVGIIKIGQFFWFFLINRI